MNAEITSKKTLHFGPCTTETYCYYHQKQCGELMYTNKMQLQNIQERRKLV